MKLFVLLITIANLYSSRKVEVQSTSYVFENKEECIKSANKFKQEYEGRFTLLRASCDEKIVQDKEVKLIY